MSGEILDHLACHRLAVQALLQVIEGSDMSLAQYEELAIEHAFSMGESLDDVGKGARNIISGAREQTYIARARGKLHPDAVPFPFRCEVLRGKCPPITRLNRMRQHYRPEGCLAAGIRPFSRAVEPGEHIEIRRAYGVPDLFDLL